MTRITNVDVNLEAKGMLQQWEFGLIWLIKAKIRILTREFGSSYPVGQFGKWGKAAVGGCTGVVINRIPLCASCTGTMMNLLCPRDFFINNEINACQSCVALNRHGDEMDECVELVFTSL